MQKKLESARDNLLSNNIIQFEVKRDMHHSKSKRLEKEAELVCSSQSIPSNEEFNLNMNSSDSNNNPLPAAANSDEVLNSMDQIMRQSQSNKVKLVNSQNSTKDQKFSKSTVEAYELQQSSG